MSRRLVAATTVLLGMQGCNVAGEPEAGIIRQALEVKPSVVAPGDTLYAVWAFENATTVDTLVFARTCPHVRIMRNDSVVILRGAEDGCPQDPGSPVLIKSGETIVGLLRIAATMYTDSGRLRPASRGEYVVTKRAYPLPTLTARFEVR